MNSKSYEKHYEKVIEKLIEETSVPESERAAIMLAQLEADMNGTSRKVPEKDMSAKVGRNDPCPCGSGKKYKKCCGR